MKWEMVFTKEKIKDKKIFNSVCLNVDVKRFPDIKLGLSGTKCESCDGFNLNTNGSYKVELDEGSFGSFPVIMSSIEDEPEELIQLRSDALKMLRKIRGMTELFKMKHQGKIIEQG